MNIITYETPCDHIDLTLPTIFLAGPTVRGNQPHLLPSWRDEAIRLFRDKGFDGNLIIPEFLKQHISDKYRYDLPEWEFYGLKNSHVILFWIPRTKELIGLTTNYEIGYWTARDRRKVIYGRPDDAYRIQYLDIMWYTDGKEQQPDDQDYRIHNTLEKSVEASMQLVIKRRLSS